MTRLLLLCTWLVLPILLLAQESQNFHPCGSNHGRSPWLKRYQAAPQDFAKGGDTTLYLPMTIHLVGSDDGQGYFSYRQLMDAVCTLNEDFIQANMHFYVQEVRYINNSAWDNHENVLDGYEMMVANDVYGTINTYFVSDPAGNCGYNLPYASMAVALGCAGPNDHTWAHEMGHHLSLPHPFLGWEGGINYDDTEAPDFSIPAPTTVTYDYTFFQDTLILDTLIIDTAIVELVDGSNCAIAADGFCDTPPDYLASRWNCNSDGLSAVSQTDPTGATFNSDGGLIMSYADDACSNRFSTEQIAAMRANLYDEKPEVLVPVTPALSVSTDPTDLYYPTGGIDVPFNLVTLEWEAVEHATKYLVEVSRLNSFPGSITSVYTVEDATTLDLTDLLEDKTYYWRVRPFNDFYFCSGFSDTEQFSTNDVSNVWGLSNRLPLRLFPNPTQAGHRLLIDLPSAMVGAAVSVQLLHLDGRLIMEQSLEGQSQDNLLMDLPEKLATGLYFVHAKTTDGQQAIGRVVIQ